ncbi:MAG: pilus assembly protein [Actinomycetota bacterium]|nr:pilus assembly protein [Actinomycetota bacterium]
MTRHVKMDHSKRGRGDDGAALVEFALVSVLLFTLVFGIIHFGYLLSFKQDMTRAAAEGARAGAVAFPATSALQDAKDATQDAVQAAGKNCGGNYAGNDSDGDGMACTVTLTPCVTADGDCVTVLLSYDQEHKPVLGAAPFVNLILPDTLTSKSEARVNPS